VTSPRSERLNEPLELLHRLADRMFHARREGVIERDLRGVKLTDDELRPAVLLPSVTVTIVSPASRIGSNS
jgi:hypothetical protein